MKKISFYNNIYKNYKYIFRRRKLFLILMKKIYFLKYQKKNKIKKYRKINLKDNESLNEYQLNFKIAWLPNYE